VFVSIVPGAGSFQFTSHITFREVDTSDVFPVVLNLDVVFVSIVPGMKRVALCAVCANF